MDTTFDSHDLHVGDKMFEGSCVRRVEQLFARNTLLALALLHQQVLTATAFKREFTASGASKTLLGAAVGLKLRHVARKGNG